jgi:hypothetical protein
MVRMAGLLVAWREGDLSGGNVSPPIGIGSQAVQVDRIACPEGWPVAAARISSVGVNLRPHYAHS